MVGTSKILTVSYGTFSCTLEGYDDPFSAMREIAEYFRDLAAEDRFFGAVPPTPDAETMARLAQGGGARRVTARIGDQPVAVPTAPQPAAAPDVFSPAAPAEGAAEPAQPFVQSAAPLDSDFAARLLRIRAAAARSAAGDADFEDSQASEPLAFAPITAAFSDRAAPASAALQGETAPVEPAAMEVTQSASSAEEAQADSAQPAATEQVSAEADILDPEPRQAAEPQPVRLVRARLVRRRKNRGGAPAPAPVAEPQPAPAEAKLEAAPAKALGYTPSFPADFALDPEDILAASEAALAVANDYIDPADVVFAHAADQAEASLPAPAVEPAEPASVSLPIPGLEDLDDDLARTLAAIRADDVLYNGPAAPAAPSVPAQPERLSFADPQIPAERSQSLAPLQLRNALRIPSPRPDDGAGADAGRARLGEGEDSVSRILKETNSQLDDSEASRRRSTIAHLKAAVAATRADQAEGLGKGEDHELDRYRDDLQRVVRPHRGEANGQARRLAPLMLISELRVDVAERTAPPSPAPSAAHPAKAADEDEPDQSGPAAPKSFAEFAERVGAKDLHDLLEAAAAYGVYVEGRPHVSRPQMMDWAMTAHERDISIEEGLRAFGSLLRTGKIQKVKRGQFSVAEETRFRPRQIA